MKKIASRSRNLGFPTPAQLGGEEQSLRIRSKLKIIGGGGRESWKNVKVRKWGGGEEEEELVTLNRATKHAHLLRGLH